MSLTASEIPIASTQVFAAFESHTKRRSRRSARLLKRNRATADAMLAEAGKAIDEILHSRDTFSSTSSYTDETASQFAELRDALDLLPGVSGEAEFQTIATQSESRKVIEAAIVALLLALIPHLGLGVIASFVARWVAPKIAALIAEWLSELLVSAAYDESAAVGVESLAIYGRAAA